MNNNKKSWYIWLSFIALAFILSDTRAQFFNLKKWKEDFGKTFDMQMVYNRQILFLVLINMLPATIFPLVNEYIAIWLNIIGLDEWLNLFCVYFLGVNASWQHVKWRRKQGLD